MRRQCRQMGDPEDSTLQRLSTIEDRLAAVFPESQSLAFTELQVHLDTLQERLDTFEVRTEPLDALQERLNAVEARFANHFMPDKLESEDACDIRTSMSDFDKRLAQSETRSAANA